MSLKWLVGTELVGTEERKKKYWRGKGCVLIGFLVALSAPVSCVSGGSFHSGFTAFAVGVALIGFGKLIMWWNKSEFK